MRIEGIDPLILNQIQTQAQKIQVQDTRKINITAEEEHRQQPEQEFDRDNVEPAVKKLNAAAEIFNIRLRFKIDYEKGEIYVLVIDTAEHKIIRRIPPENLLKVANQIEYLVGLLLDELI